MTVYGIKNCNTVKSAMEWLKAHRVEVEFHDYKTKGITLEKLKSWSRQTGWEALVNKRGTTWRQLDDDTKAEITSEKAALELMMEKTSVIRRPLIEDKGKVVALGFDEAAYQKIFG